MKGRSFLTRLLRVLLAAGAGIVILLALAVGGFRLLVAQLPSYQAELKQWVDSSLGLTLDFDHMDARLGLRGPELTFRGVSVTAAGEPRPFLAADKASITIDPWTAIVKRRLRIGRLSFDGTRLTLVRERGGELHLLGAPAGRETKLDLALLVPPGVEIGVSNSSVAYVDRSSGVSWRFQNVHAALTRGRDSLELDASAEPPPELGGRFELDAETELRSLNDLGQNWRLFADLRDVDLGALALALPSETEIPVRGNGDVGLWLEWHGGRLEHAMLETALDGVAWASGGPPAGTAATSSAPDPQRGARTNLAAYRHVALSAEWLRTSDGWRLMLNDIDLQRAGRTWPRGTDAILDVGQDGGGVDKLALRSDFVRLEDLAPFVRALPRSALAQRWLELDPHGELTGVNLSLQKKDQSWDYSVAGRFDRLGLKASGRWPGFEGLSGELHADASGGRATLATHDAALHWPQLFRQPLQAGNLSGLVVWRKGFDGVRVVSNDLQLANADGSTRSSLELTLPLDGSSPRLDMETHFGPFDVVAAKHYLPVHKMPAAVVRWLDGAIQDGRVTQADLRFVGPLAAFPFDGGEGKFRVVASIKGGVLEYARDWPRAEDLDGQVEFVNASFAARAKGRVLRNAGRNVRVDIADLRKARLVLHADTNGPLADVLAFLQGAPPIAERLGPGYERLHAPAGRGAVTLDLGLPLHDLPAYRLDAKLGIANATLAVDGFEPRVTGITGKLELSDGKLRGQGLQGVFLNGPITADVQPPPPSLSSYRAAIDFKGEVTADAVTNAFHLPFGKLAGGQTHWQGQLLIPGQPQDGESEPLKIDVSSNLAGLALNFPAPFAKAPADPLSLGLAIE
ncbi:MAG TPA: DUF3971 domain-containing protein, partial [Gammaproteobacteria bacterium]|nr:DUF3971 domain-containing protein [Gammaproteobacteria bacterium]